MRNPSSSFYFFVEKFHQYKIFSVCTAKTHNLPNELVINLFPTKDIMSATGLKTILRSREGSVFWHPTSENNSVEIFAFHFTTIFLNLPTNAE